MEFLLEKKDEDRESVVQLHLVLADGWNLGSEYSFEKVGIKVFINGHHE